MELLKNDLTQEVRSVNTDVNRGLNAIDGLKTAVSENSQKLDHMCDRMTHIENSHEALQQQFTGIESRVTNLESGITEETGTRFSEINMRLDELEQESYNSKLILTVDPPLCSTQSRDSTEIVRNHLISELNLSESQVLALSAHRISSEMKKFILSINDQTARHAIFRKCKELKPQHLNINEFLTKRRHILMYDLRRLRDRNTQIKRVYSDHGRVYVTIDGRENPLLVMKIEDVTELL